MKKQLSKPKQILFVSGREIDYTRNDVIIRALSQIGNVEVIGAIGSGSILWRSIYFAIKSLWYNFTQNYDVIVVGFYGHLLMLPLGLFTRTPIVFDAFLSTFDTLVEDRQQFSGTSILGRLAYWLDKTACSLATHVVLDTPQHIEYFAKTFHLPANKFSCIPVGCNEDIFHPRQFVKTDRRETTVLFYGSYLPLHGTDIIVRAAAMLANESIRFKMIGQGPKYAETVALAQKLQLKNIDFLPPVPLIELPEHIASADICIGGHFGTSQKAARVVPGKIYQMLAMARPVIAAASAANTSILVDNITAKLCSPNDPEGLSEAILELHRKSYQRVRLGKNGYNLYKQTFSETAIVKHLQHIISTTTKL